MYCYYTYYRYTSSPEGHLSWRWRWWNIARRRRWWEISRRWRWHGIVATRWLLPRSLLWLLPWGWLRWRLLPRSCAAAAAAAAAVSTSTPVGPRRRSTSRASIASAIAISAVVATTVLPRCRTASALARLLPWSSSTSRTTLPWRSWTSSAVSVSSASFVSNLALGYRSVQGRSATTANLVHELLVVSLDGILWSARWEIAAEVTALAIWTVASHVTSITADATDDISSKVALLRTIVFPVANLAAVLAGLVFVVTKSTVECGKLTKLIALQFVLAFWYGGSSLDDIVDQLFRLVDLLFRVCHDQAVQVFVLVTGVSGIRFALSFFDGALSTNGDLGAGLCLHLLERVTTRANEEADC